MNSTTRHRATRRQTLRRALQLESLESRQLMAGDVSGTIFEDLNQNGSRDGSESGVAAGWRVFIDTNLNGAFNTGEPTGQTNVDGDYLITGVQAGLRRLSIEIPLGWTPTKPLSQDVTVENGKETKKADFFAFAGGTIKGEVWNDTDGNGNRDTDPTTGQFIDVGLGGWTVFLDLNKSGILDTGEPETKTDSIGAYQFTNVPAGDYEVTEVLPEGWEASKGYDSKQTAGVTALGTVVQDFANFSLVNGSIEGTVWLDTDGDGDRAKDPTTGLPTEPGLKDWVIILDQNFNGEWDTGELSASTDSDGTYRFASVPEGAYNVLEVMPEGAWSISPGFSNPLLVNVLAGEKSNNVDFANFTVLNGGIAGTIWNDLNRDGVRNTNLAGEYLEPGLEAWTVVLDMNRNGTLDVGEPSATTDVNGSYNFADLQIGEYDLIEMVQTGWETAPGFSGDQSVRVYSGATTTAGDFANFNLSTLVAGSIAGTVWNDDNGNGSQDITESGIEGWTVYADLDSSGSYSTGEPQATSGVDGSYLIAGVNPGTVTVRASVAAGWQATAPLTASRTLVLKNGESILGIGFGAKQIHDSAITGVAFADTNKNGVRDAGERGLSGITIFVDLNNNGSLDSGEPSQLSSTDQFFTPGTDETGTFSFTHLAVGSYQVRQILPATLSATPSSELVKSVTVSASASTAPIKFADVFRANEIRGSLFDDSNGNSLRDAGELPLSGKRVFIDLDRDNIRDIDEPESITDSEGKYTFVDLASGIYVVRQELESGDDLTYPNTVGGILWPTGTSHPSIGNVTPSEVTVSLAKDQSIRQNYSITLPGTGGLSSMVDVFLLFDDTGSFVNNSPIVRGAFPTIISQLQASLPGVDMGFGVGRFEEYANFAYEYDSGRPFVLNQPIVASSTAGYMAAVQAALDRTTPGYGGDEPETDIEALYQLVTGKGFDGNNNGTVSDSGAAGLGSTQLSPGFSGDVPSFASFHADAGAGVLSPDGTVGGGGFRAGALPVVLLATDTGFAYQPKGESSITGLGGLSLPVSSLTGTSRSTTPNDQGAGLQETVTALNALGALVIGLGTNADSNVDPRQALESLSRLTGAINQTTTTIDNGTVDPIAPGDPLYFEIASGFATSVANGVTKAIQNAVTNVAMNITLRASDPRVRIINHSGTAVGVKAGQTANFDVEFIGDGAPHRFDLLFVREGTDVVLGSIPVVIGTPIAGDGYHFEDLEEGEIEDLADFGSHHSSSTSNPNIAPSFLVGPAQTITEDAGAQSVVGWATGISAGPSSESWQFVSFTVTTDHPELFSVPPTVSPTGTLTYQTASNAFGTALVNVVLRDNGGTASGGVDTSLPQSFAITVTTVNDSPVANDESYITAEDSTLAIASPGVLGNDTDVDFDTLTARLVSSTTNGTLTLGADGIFSYIPNTGFNGTDSFTYVANDGTADSNLATVVISVSASNDAPDAVNDAFTVVEDTTLTVAAPGVLANDTDIDSSSLTAVVVSGPAHGTLSLSNDGSLSYTPNANFVGSDSFTYVANDGTVDSNVATVVISVTASNDAPVAVNDAYSAVEDTTLTVAAPGVLANDTDIDSSSLTAVIVSGPAHGALSLNSDGSLSYTPNANFVGTDSFTYVANDGTDDSNVATVVISVSATNDAPLAVNDSYSIAEDNTLSIAAPGVLANDSDPEGDALSVVLVSSPTKGSISLQADGSFVYTPNLNATGSDSFTYLVNDGLSNSNIATVDLQITPVNDEPKAVNDSYSVVSGANLIVSAPGVLANDSDVEGQPLSATIVTSPSSGSVTMNANGSFNYVPNPGFSGTDSFTYQANDGSLSSNVATVTITVTPLATTKTNFLVIDQSRRRFYEYDSAGNAIGNTRLDKEDQSPLGLAVSQDGTRRWVVDSKGEIFVYDASSRLIGTWELKGIDKPEGITVSGNDLWIVDRESASVAYFKGGASRLSGSASATSTFKLNRNNQTPKDLVTDGSTIWVVNDGSSSDSVFVYSKAGAMLGSWTVDARNTQSTGITLDPSSAGNLLIVDSKTDLVYQYDSSASLRSGKAAASRTMALDANNGNAQAIAATPSASSPSTLSRTSGSSSTSLSTPSSVSPRDVNEDGRTSAVDALLVIDYLNSGTRVGWESSWWLLDVNNDGRVSPVDALGVIDAIHTGRTSEGELSLRDDALLDLLADSELETLESLTHRRKR